MPLSTDVIVRKEVVVFPRKCVVCRQPVDGEVVGLRGNPVGFHGVVPWLLGRTRRLEVPAHRDCGAKLARAMALRNLSLIIGVVVVLACAVSLGLTKWQVIGLAVAAIAVPIVYQVIRPLAFEFTHQSGRFKLMFLDPGYARETAGLNDGELEDVDEPPAGPAGDSTP